MRRRSVLDALPATIEPPFKVLGTSTDRLAIQSGAQPMEMVVLQGFTREIEDAFQRSGMRPELFWTSSPQVIETARKLDDLLASIQSRKSK